MHEHGSEERRKITCWICLEATRNERPPPNKIFTSAELQKEKQNVERDQGIRNYRNSSFSRIVITDWEHKIYLRFFWLDFSQLISCDLSCLVSDH
jgi:hypothetical protein